VPERSTAGALETRLAAAGASVENRLVAAGHELGAADLDLAKAYRERIIG
jgi:phospholipase/carboxylesterase